MVKIFFLLSSGQSWDATAGVMRLHAYVHRTHVLNFSPSFDGNFSEENSLKKER